MQITWDKIKHTKNAIVSRLRKLKAANDLIADNDIAMNMLLTAHGISKNPDAKLKLALKLGIPAAGIAGILIGGSKANRDAMAYHDEDY